MKRFAMAVLVVAALAGMAEARTAWDNAPSYTDIPINEPSTINVNTRRDNFGNLYRAENGLVFDGNGNVFQPTGNGVVNVKTGHFIQFVK